MPHGELFIRATGGGEFEDAYDTYGLSLNEEGLSRLMTPAPLKEPVSNKNVITHGASILQSSLVKDVRQVSLGMHISAPDKTTFLSRYASFCQLLDNGFIDIKTKYQEGVVYHFIYLDCTQFSEFNRELAKFTLSLEEPHPESRT